MSPDVDHIAVFNFTKRLYSEYLSESLECHIAQLGFLAAFGHVDALYVPFVLGIRADIRELVKKLVNHFISLFLVLVLHLTNER